MKRLFLLVLFGLGMLLAGGVVAADDITGADDLLCSSMIATQCLADGTCAAGPLWQWNMPPFVEIDLKNKRLNSTAASGDRRSTPITIVDRIDHSLVIQGHEGGRAFSLIVAQDTGVASMAIVLEGEILTVLGACTPHEPVN